MKRIKLIIKCLYLPNGALDEAIEEIDAIGLYYSNKRPCQPVDCAKTIKGILRQIKRADPIILEDRNDH